LSESKIELVEDIASKIAKDVPIKAHAHLLSVSRHFNTIFASSFNNKRKLTLMTLIVEGNVNGCDLIKLSQKPNEEACKKIRRNQYIVTDKGLFYFHCKTQKLVELPLLKGKSLELLAQTLKIENMRVANRNDQKLITDYTGHVYQDTLIDLIESEPTLLFTTYPLIKAFGQEYHHFSPYLLMAFLGEWDMLATIMSLEKVITAIHNNKKLQTLYKNQYQEILDGGADFVKIDRDPREISFEELIQYKQTYSLYRGTQHTLVFPLLENKDGIFCHHEKDDENQPFHFFYVHKENQTIKPLDDSFITDLPAFERLKKSIITMEYNSSRRLSEDEYHFIQQAFNISLVHQGLLYKNNGVLYRDSRAPFFNLENAYRKCTRLYEEARHHNNNWAIGHKSWREDVGVEQFKIAWVWQRLCEEGKPFDPFDPTLFDDFRRGSWVYNFETKKDVLVLDSGDIKLTDLGIYRQDAVPWCRGERGMAVKVVRDLVAIHWLIKNAKTKVIEFKPVEELQKEIEFEPTQELQIDCTIPEFEIGVITLWF
jgi:hypothetical protein